jgi:succinate dehydrogenase / fumarate reductase cytochrome b subunit
MARPRPKYLNLFQIRLPVAGVISIMHRVSGAVLFLFIPFLLALLELSLESPQSFFRFQELFSHWALKLTLIGLIWGYLHHLLAGIRHLALDLHYGTGLPAARASSWVVLAGAIALTAVFGVKLW